ncbi:MAG: hypothetical protein EPN99_15235 [Frankiales bacterium]|nr:MAG: hypothetical protein EPN99_15235 [Frankiales bacterium]
MRVRDTTGAAEDVDPAFDEALARIRELSVRLHGVLDLHDARRTLLGGRVCRCCSRAFPCPTVQRAAG